VRIRQGWFDKPGANKETDMLEDLVSHLESSVPRDIADARIALEELTVLTSADEVIALLIFLRDDEGCRFICLLDICGVDWPEREKRFEVVYHLLSPAKMEDQD
jgi:NADH-quinone oxidoreductase subunit C